MNSPIEYDDDVERRNTHPLLMSYYKSDRGVVSLEKNTMEKSVVNCGVSKTKKVHNNTLRRGSTGSLCQRAGKQLEQRRSELGYKN